MTLPAIHRVVTGHDEEGNAIISLNGPLPTSVELTAIPGVVFHEVWNTDSTPAVINNGQDPTLGALSLPPPKNGTRIRFVDIPPDSDELTTRSASELKEAFSEIGDAKASTASHSAPHPLMHRTESIDYGIVIEGELTLILDDSEVVVKPGSVVVQRGTNHAWANRSGKTCRILFVLVDGVYNPEIAEAISSCDD
ncbi:cupin [Hahella sp. CCB-MM4]|uniref:cupin domain-containing protein n=1 Tax=Hahella sp. (strain CCB-MM4) TaxID=1926491 RepID=UPI000B9AEEC7|nr:cupin domain-containing protein [Hahella sp. CCB-MM4]OZG73940.1 cupin [Hahella sp. CCB-MM4]